MDGKTYAGIDLGGTKLLVGEMDARGNILRYGRFENGARDMEGAYVLMEEALASFLGGGQRAAIAIGAGIAGHIDGRSGVWKSITDGDDTAIPVSERLSARFGLPAFAENDVKSATKAELMFGYGRESRDFVYINVGTGIGAGIVAGGRLITGSHANAGEAGHTSSGLGIRVPCVCGREDCVETVASGSGLDASARLLIKDYPNSALRLPEDGRVSAREVFALSDSDELCAKLTDNAARGLANLIMHLVRFSDPDTVVLGGGVAADGFLLRKAERYLNKHTMRYVTRGVRITRLDPNFAGLIGACAGAMMGMNEAPM